MIFRIGRDGTCLDFKDGFRSKAMLPPGGFVGKSLSVILPPGVAAALALRLAAAFGAAGVLRAAVFFAGAFRGLVLYPEAGFASACESRPRG